MIVESADYPSFLYDMEVHDPLVFDSGLFRGPLLVSVRRLVLRFPGTDRFTGRQGTIFWRVEWYIECPQNG